jgi:para-nitrobenzyl esterase
MASASLREGVPQPTVETTTGKIRGVTDAGVSIFKGIPYGASTAGKNRFMPPVAVTPWGGVRDAFDYGPSAPQNPSSMRGLVDPRGGFAAYGDAPGIEENEDCLVLNVWTRGLNDGGKRPVMFWCHGGGFAASSGSPLMYGGERLAQRGDVVVVTVNHRLGALGYTYLGGVGSDRFASSVNVGMLDLVAALEWVRDNIERFGGDPGNVTIFGESGGGAKVSTLLAMPSAKGLFHRGVIQSGPGVWMSEPARSVEVADMLLTELGLDRARIGEIQNVAMERIKAAQAAVERKLGPRLAGMRNGFVPVVDGQVLPQHPFHPKASPVGADVPVMIGYNRTETTLFLAGDRAAFTLDEEGLRQRVKVILRDKSEQVIEEFRAANPGATPSQLFFLIGSEAMMGANSRKIAQRKSEQGRAPAYFYRFDWETPVAGGRLKSPHALEITFVFDHAGEPLAPRLAPDGAEVHALAADMSSRWIGFARTGNPDISSSLNWPAYSTAERATMIFNSPCRVEKDPSRQERLAIDRALFPAETP